MQITYRIVLVPRGPAGRFNPPQVVESGAPPQFEGGAVIISQPTWLPGPNDPGPAPEGRGPMRQAWPLDLLGAVVVYDIERQDDGQ